MKRIILALLVVVLLVGCATTPGQSPVISDEQAQDMVIEITARRLAFYVGANNPEIIEPGIAFCAAFISEEADLGPMLALGINYLDDELAGDPLLKPDLETLLKAFNVAIIEPNINLTDRQKAMIRLAASSFKRGLELAKANPKE